MEEEGEEQQQQQEQTTQARSFTHALVQRSTLSEETQADAVEIVTTACEKFTGNNEMAAKWIKDEMDKKTGACWHVVVGEGYGFSISIKNTKVLYLYCAGNLAIIIWQCT